MNREKRERMKGRAPEEDEPKSRNETQPRQPQRDQMRGSASQESERPLREQQGPRKLPLPD